ncbi:MAG TPA: 1-acyl-sn-glycerol-3-phosphate acyltransferase [Clostridia bacterium]|nr:1-acyl-sn-glycerol-3-phosphate acyltransferase [Clostridia bacterium]
MTLYRILRPIAWLILKLWNRLEVHGLENLPPQGKLIVVANHVSVLDPIVLGVGLPRPIRFMAKKELFDIPVLGGLISLLGSFPVDRNKTDFQAVKQSLRILASQEVLGIFPEGGTRKNATRIVFSTGAAAIALKSKSPVLPVAIIGTASIPKAILFGKLKVNIGPVITWPQQYEGKLQDDDVERLTREMEKAVQGLKSA